jgi:hypothetical protein
MLERPSDASRVINTQLSPIIKYIIGILCCICIPCFPKGFWWSYARAPEPSDIYWQNLGVSSFARIWRGGASLAGTTVIMGISIFFINLLKSAQLNHMKESEGKDIEMSS